MGAIVNAYSIAHLGEKFVVACAVEQVDQRSTGLLLPVSLYHQFLELFERELVVSIIIDVDNFQDKPQ